MKKTKDPVNQILIELENDIGRQELGILNNYTWYDDPRRLVITLSRYKFVSKMLSGKDKVAEIGCGDGFGSRIVRQEVKNLLITDYDPLFINDFIERNKNNRWRTSAKVHDILESPLREKQDAVYSLDVMEHMNKNQEKTYLMNICLSLNKNGVAIIGMPTRESQKYASSASIEGHVNCQSGDELRKTLNNFFSHVFIFSMNDEVVHTGFYKMAHYIFALCLNQK